MAKTSEDKKYETIGRAVLRISYWLYALKIIAIVSVIALAMLFFLQKPLWWAPVIGVAVFLIYRFLRVTLFSALIRFGRASNGEQDKGDT